MWLCRILVVIVLAGGLAAVATAGIYRYQDENGQWVFSDEKPAGGEAEQVRVEVRAQRTNEPEIIKKREGGQHVLAFRNPWFLPVELGLRADALPGGALRTLVGPNATVELHRSQYPIDVREHVWVMGDPAASPDRQAEYRFPVSSSGFFDITQGFNGQFSHQHRPNVNAVDIGMPLGTWIAAARAGVVARIKQNYHHSGTTRFFADKANLIVVLHDDGSYAIYAHLLPESAVVEPGQRVEAGDRLARSASSGFSTGPHLHFVVRYNTGLRPVSLPFRFQDKGGVVTPRAGQRLQGQAPP
jgi:murein DD-endopeptidase MepM/ murein hydrolase activator NlpD